MSPQTVGSILFDMCSEIIKIDPKNKELYEKKTKNFYTRLDSLHNYLSYNLKVIKDKKIFTAHNSLMHFIKEFCLLYGGVVEDSPGKEVGTKFYANLIQQIKKSKVKCIFSEPQLNIKFISNIAKELNINVIELDPINSKFKSPTYIEFISQNANKMINGLK